MVTVKARTYREWPRSPDGFFYILSFWSIWDATVGVLGAAERNGQPNGPTVNLAAFFFLFFNSWRRQLGVGGQRSDSFGNKLATVRGCPIGPNSTRLAMGLLGTLGTHLHLALVHTQRPKYLGAHGSPLISPHD